MRNTAAGDHEVSDATRRRHADSRVNNFMIDWGKRFPACGTARLAKTGIKVAEPVDCGIRAIY
jgi:hypothetical protein